MAIQPIQFPLQAADVAKLLFLSENWESLNSSGGAESERKRGHTFNKHLADSFLDIKTLTFEHLQLSGRSEANITAFRDSTELCQAAQVVLNSACGRFAVADLEGRHVGIRGELQSWIPTMLARTGEAGRLEKRLGVAGANPGDLDDAVALGIEQMSRACMVLEVAPEHFPFRVKVHTFYPIRAFASGKTPWYRAIGLNNQPIGQRIPVPR